MFDVTFFVCTLCFDFLSLNLTITLSRFVIRGRACVDLRVQLLDQLTTKPYKLYPPEHCRDYLGLKSRVSLLWYCALPTAFFTKWTIQEYNNKELHFLVTTKSDWNYSHFFEKLSNLSVSSLSRSVISVNYANSSMSSSLLRFSIWLVLNKKHFS